MLGFGTLDQILEGSKSIRPPQTCRSIRTPRKQKLTVRAEERTNPAGAHGRVIESNSRIGVPKTHCDIGPLNQYVAVRTEDPGGMPRPRLADFNRLCS